MNDGWSTAEAWFWRGRHLKLLGKLSGWGLLLSMIALIPFASSGHGFALVVMILGWVLIHQSAIWDQIDRLQRVNEELQKRLEDRPAESAAKRNL